MLQLHAVSEDAARVGAGNCSRLYTLCCVTSRLALSLLAAFKWWAAGQQNGGRDSLLPSGKE